MKDRVALYVCAECGDLGCGAFTARIEKSASYITWGDFGFENNYDNTVDRDAFTSVGTFHLDRREYEDLINAFLPR